ncbi:MAG: cadmium-translocating P-type ATPase [Fibrobacter sp.]|nr:cadmium-translocating P-type ATPase [Fibrobacter sp.]
MKKFNVKGLDCADCASRIEDHLRKLPVVSEVSLDYASLTLHIDTTDIETVRREIKKIEPEVDISVPEPLKEEKPGFRPKKEILTISIALVLFLIVLFFEGTFHARGWGVVEYAIALAAYFLAGYNVLKSAFRTVTRGGFFDENVLMAIATLGAFAVHAISEAIGVMIFFKIGEFLQNLAVSRSRRSITALLQIRPDYAVVKQGDLTKKISPETVRPGEVILVKAGEKIPLDGVVKEGSSLVNTSALTGEPVPSTVNPGDIVLAGEVNISALLTIKVTKAFADSSMAKILDLVENANAKKTRTEQFITGFARYYTPAVVFLSLCIALLPPLLVPGQTFETWVYRALVLLVISCPCALVISIPLGYFGGIGGASKRGILVKGSTFIDVLAGVKTVVFDKTGTLTKGVFKVKETVTRNGHSASDILKFAAIAETFSNHPIAGSIIEAAGHRRGDVTEQILDHQEISGFGVKVRTEKYAIIAGNDALLHREGIAHDCCNVEGTVVHVVIDGTYAGYIIIGDELKEDSLQAVQMLRKAGVQTVSMLTGDNKASAGAVAGALGLDSFYAGLLPEEKVSRFEEISAAQKQSGKVAFVGDGINDSPVIARADVGIAMGALGSDAAIETADVVLMTDHPSKVAEAINAGKRTRAIVWQNIILALSVKALFIGFGAVGLAGMWEAVFADMGMALVAVLNSSRALQGGKT